MKDIYISSITPKGEVALKKHLEETKKLSLKNKLIFKTAGFKQEVISVENPVKIVLRIKNSFSSNPLYLDLVLEQITTALESNGAVKNKDFLLV